jgi:lipopolysaccharide transport protein LptA
MANSLSRFWICALALGSSALAAQGGRPANELLLEMQAVEIDNKTNLINLRGPRISQGDMSIAADQAVATGIDFQSKSEWKFTGNVRITLDSALVTADTAVFSFDDEELARGELAGNATFEDKQPDEAEPARGGASKIAYDYTGRTLRLTDNAWFQGDGVQAEGCDLVYNLTTERVTSGSTECADLFRIRFLPKQDAAGADPPQ